MAKLRFAQILVATDLSVASRAAYGHAVAFARAFGAGITVLHVDESDAAAAGVPELAQERELASEERGREMERVVANFEALGLKSKVEQAEGNAYREILERAETAAYDLLVMAKHGVRENNPGLMGTTAERVMHNAHLPVVMAYNSEPSFGHVASYERFAVSTDYSEDSRFGIRRVLDLAESFDAQVEVLHAITLGADPPGSATSRQAWRASYAEAQLAHLNERLADEIGNPRAVGRIHAGLRVPETVIAGALQAQSDLLCVPTHGKGAIRRAIFGSIADRVMRIAPLPSMIMPRQWLRG